MAGENRLFLKKLRTSWKQQFPFLQSVDLDEVPRVQKGCNFRCDKYAVKRGVYYFFRITFDTKYRGRFTVGVSISSSLEKSILEHGLWPLSEAKSTGMFGIWQILERRYLAWDLVDWRTETNQFFTGAGVPEVGFSANKSEDIWQPVSYNAPVETIVDAAIADLNKVLQEEVFPRLEIAP